MDLMATFAKSAEALAAFSPPVLQPSVAEKNRALSGAHHFQSLGLRLAASVLFSRVAKLELRLTIEPGPPGPERRVLYAASSLGLAGDLQAAIALFGESPPEELSGFVQKLQANRADGGRVASQLRVAFETSDLDALLRLSVEGPGLIAPKALLWPLFRVAKRVGESALADQALDALLVSEWDHLPFHFVRFDTSRGTRGELQYASYLVAGFPKDYRAHAAHVMALLRLGMRGDAVDVVPTLLRYLDAPADDSHAQRVYGYMAGIAAYRRSGQLEDALAVARRGLQATGGDPELRTLYALVLLDAERLVEAADALAVAKFDPRRTSTLPGVMGAHTLLRLGRPREAITMLEGLMSETDEPAAQARIAAATSVVREALGEEAIANSLRVRAEQLDRQSARTVAITFTTPTFAKTASDLSFKSLMDRGIAPSMAAA